MYPPIVCFASIIGRHQGNLSVDYRDVSSDSAFDGEYYSSSISQHAIVMYPPIARFMETRAHPRRVTVRDVCL